MTELTISNSNFAPLKDKVVVVTGCASGIGLATVKELISVGAKVVGGDLHPSKPDVSNAGFEYVQVNVTEWKALVGLFKAGIEKFGRIDHVFANAGIRTQASLLDDDFDEDGELNEPNHVVFDINLRAVVNTIKLGIHHVRTNPNGGSIVATASASSWQRFPHWDYCSTKHAVHGLVRGLYANIGPNTAIPVRINAIAPSWTNTNILEQSMVEKAGLHLQGPEIAARSALLVMADEHRHGQVIFSQQGKYFEIESRLLEATESIMQSAPTVHKRIRTEADDAEAIRQIYIEAARNS